MNPEQITQLREDLGLTPEVMGLVMDAGVTTILAWEAGAQFPSKRDVTGMLALRRFAEYSKPEQNNA